MPSPCAVTRPVQPGLPSHRIAARDANGPNSSTSIAVDAVPRPVTWMRSKIVARGRTTSADATVVTRGTTRTRSGAAADVTRCDDGATRRWLFTAAGCVVAASTRGSVEARGSVVAVTRTAAEL